MLSFSFNFIFCFSPEANSPTATQRYKWRTNSTEKKVISGCHHSSVDLSSPSILPPQVRVPSTPSTLFSIYIVQIVYLSFELECEKNKNKQKEAGIVPFKKRKLTHLEAGWKGWVRVFRGKACPVERRSLRWDWRGRTRRPVRHRRTPSSRENAVIVSLCESPGS